MGKRTLLQRLQGNDPYAPDAANDQVPASVTIPYLPPTGMPTWNRIQLQVGRVNSDEQALPKVDFVVVLIRPTNEHSLEDIQSHTLHVVRSYLQHLEYSRNDPPKDENDNSGGVRLSVCICIMINFRDLLQDDHETNSRVQELEQHLESFLRNTLKLYAIPKDRLLLQFISTSLLNCYGLNRLHNFIYRTYLQKKQEALEAQLRAVTLQIQNTAEPEFVSYTDFVKLLAPLEQSNEDNNNDNDNNRAPPPSQKTRQPSSRQRGEPPEQQTSEQKVGSSKAHPDTRESAHHQQPVSKSSRRGAKAAEHSPHDNGIESPRGGGRGGRRQLYPHAQQSARVGKDALEAFLASDSSDEDRPKMKKKKQRAKPKKKDKKTVSSRHPVDSSDDDDDDFFYDESGRFKNTKVISHNDDVSSSSSASSSSSSDDGNRGVTMSRQAQASKTDPSTPKQKEADLMPNRRISTAPPQRNDWKQKPSPTANIPNLDTQTVSHETPQPPRLKTEINQARDAHDNNDDDDSDADERIVEIKNDAPTVENKQQGTGKVGSEQSTETSNQVSPHTSNKDAGTTSSVTRDEEVVEETGPASRELSTDKTEPSNIPSQTMPSPNDKVVDSDSSDDKVTKQDHPNNADEMVKAEVPKSKEQHPVQRKDSSSDEDDSHFVARAPPAADDDIDDDEFFVGGEEKENSDNEAQPKSGVHSLKEEDSDDEFFMEQGQQQQDPEPEAVRQSEDHKVSVKHESAPEPTPPEPSPEKTSSPDLKRPDEDAPLPQIGTTRSTSVDDDSDEDDEFFVSGEGGNAQAGTASSHSVARPPRAAEEQPTLSASSSMTGEEMKTSAPSSGISAAALAAIQAAQKEAEAMLLQSEERAVNGDGMRKPKKSKKEKKSKKDGSEKKKKKKKEKSKSDRVVDDSD